MYINRLYTDKTFCSFDHLWEILCHVSLSSAFVRRLPQHLRNFSAEFLQTKALFMSINDLKHVQEFDIAIRALTLLLSQKLYNVDGRGQWSVALSLILQVNHGQAAGVCGVSSSPGFMKPVTKM